MRKPFRHLANLLRFNRGESIPIMGPLKAEWEVINQCNARCKTCLHWRGQPDPGILSTGEGKALIEQLARCGVLGLGFTGGEPLLRKDLTELLAHARGVGLRTTLMTNGLLITERRARELVDSGLETVFISLDAANPKLNDDLRGLNGYFHLAMSAIDNLKAMRRNGKPNIVIKTTVSNKNVRQLVPLAALARKKGIEGFSFQLAQRLEKAGFVFDKSLLLSRVNQRVLVREMNTLTCQYRGLLAGTLEYYQALGEYLKKPEAWKKYRPITGFSYALIDAWGNVFTCPAKLSQLGNVREHRFDEIWYGQTANQLRVQRSSPSETSYLFDGVGSMSVFVNQLTFKRMLRLLRPIPAGGKYL